MHMLVKYGNCEVINFLHATSPTMVATLLSLKNEDGYCPLVLAASLERTDMCCALVIYGANLKRIYRDLKNGHRTSKAKD